MYSNPDFESLLDTKTNLIGFENGIYDLTTDTFRSGRSDDYITFSTGYDYKAYVDGCPEITDITQYLMRTFPQPKVEGDPYTMLEAVLTIYSSFLSGGNSEQHFYIQSNRGSNGKSQLVKLLDMTLGDYSKTVKSALFTESLKPNTVQATPELALLRGVRLIHAEEPDEDDKFNIGTIKELTGGSSVSARELYKNNITYVPQFHCIFSCNKKPSFKNTTPDDIATWRRIKNIPFVSTFVDSDVSEDSSHYIYHKDKDLDTKFSLWKSAFMSILLSYYRTQYSPHGISLVSCMKLADSEYQSTSDPFYDYFQDHIEIVSDSETSSENLGLTLSQIWNSYKNDKVYYQKGILMKDLRKYLTNQKYTMIAEKRTSDCHYRNLYPQLRWISEKPKISNSNPNQSPPYQFESNE